MNAQQLKNSILQLAVQGKLVPQDPNDEPASALIEKIRAEKERLIKEKKIKPDKNPSYIFRGSDNLPYEKVGKNEPVCIADEVPFDIPDSWEWVRLNEAVLYTTDYVANGSFATLRENVKNYKTENYALLVKTQDFSNNFTRNLTYIDKQGYEFLAKSKLYGGELMLSNIGASIGKAFIIPKLDKPMSLAPNSIIVKCINDTMTQFIKYLILSPFGQDILKNFTAGTAMPKFSKTQLRGTLMPLPPLKEQQRIVDKLKELEPYINDYDKAYEKIEKLNTDFPDLLKKSILQEAVQGKLVPQDQTDEPASELLKRIKAEKEQLIKDGKIKKEKLLPPITEDEIQFEIPDSWQWCKLGELGLSNIGLTYTPTDITNSTNGIPVLRSSNIQNNKIDLNDLVRVTTEIKNANLFVEKGDILICARNGSKHLVGKSAIIETLDEPMTFGAFMAIFRSNINKWVKVYLDSPLFKKTLESVNTVTINQITQSNLKNAIIPLPPLAEQRRIVTKVEELMNIVDCLKKG